MRTWVSNKLGAIFEAELKSDLQTADVAAVEIEIGTTAEAAADILRIETTGFLCRGGRQRTDMGLCLKEECASRDCRGFDDGGSTEAAVAAEILLRQACKQQIKTAMGN